MEAQKYTKNQKKKKEQFLNKMKNSLYFLERLITMKNRAEKR